MDTKVHTESTGTFQYLDGSSAHTLATFKGLIEGEVGLLRYARLCNNDADFAEKRDTFIEKLLLRNYTGKKVASATNSIIHVHRAQYIMNKPKCYTSYP